MREKREESMVKGIDIEHCPHNACLKRKKGKGGGAVCSPLI